MKNEMNRGTSRRDFLKMAGAGAAAAMYGCKAGGRSGGEVSTGTMSYRVNPRSGDRVSLLGYGCMRWPLKRGDGGGEEIDQEAVNELVDYAIAHGVNYFDTAPMYIRGWAETATGIALKRHPRDKFFVATKMSNFEEGDWSRQASVAMYHRSMKALQVDYLDYYLLHNVGRAGMDVFRKRFLDNGVLDYLLEERAAGRVRNLGWSFHGDVRVFDYLLARDDVQWDFALIQLNYMDWLHATGMNTNAEYLYGELVKRHIPAVVMEPLLGGRLSRLPPDALALLKARRPEDSPASWAFRYAGSPENVLTVLSGMVYMEHLQENVRAYSPLKMLNEHDYETLERVTEVMVGSNFIPCTGCQYCMPCPYGLDIPGIFTFYNRCITEGNVPKEAGDENYRRARRAFLLGFDRDVARERQFDRCTGCSICVQRCPQSISILENMERIDQMMERLRQETGG
jgi:predicted aldo/keto reductase-like oxidoreductase